MPSIFSKIVNGEIPCYKVAEDENYFAFLDIAPLKKGHTLVIPKKETDYIFDLNKNEYDGLFDFARKVAMGIKEAIPCNRISIQVIGLEVPHAHIHLIPINTMNDCNFKNEKLNFSADEFKETAQKIASHIQL
ncbi:MAG: HIT family protein [Bacteroidia bacterium]|nr:HIT family protein [Bacteroidia bacterium]